MSEGMKICRLCFTLIFGDDDPIEGSLKMMLGIITPELKFNITEHPIMCKECLNSTQKAFEFKTQFFEVEEIIESKKVEKNQDNPTLTSLLSNNKSSKPSKVNYCRTCSMKIEGQLYFDAKESSNTQKKILSILKNCLYEMPLHSRSIIISDMNYAALPIESKNQDFSLTSDCKICLICYDKLQEMEKFKRNCTQNEQSIDQYIQENKLKSNITLSLHDIVAVTIKQEIDVHDIKTELCDDETCYNMVEGSVKTENIFNITKLEPIPNNNQPQGTEKRERRAIQIVKINNINHCPYCTFTSKFKSKVIRHLLNFHRQHYHKKRFYECKECSYSTSKNIEMTKHLLDHANVEMFSCTKCPFKSFQKTELTKHVFSHLDQHTIQLYSLAGLIRTKNIVKDPEV